MDFHSMLRDIVAGGMAGSMGMAIGVPLDTVKVRMQSMPDRYRTPVQSFASTFKEEGMRGFFRGSLSPLSAQIVINALCFSAESLAMRILEPGLGPHETGSALNICLAGSFGGFVQCFALVPTDLIKCKLQVDSNTTTNAKAKYRGIIHCASETMKAEGFLGLFRGFGVTVLREVPSYAVYFSTYRYVKRLTTPEGSDEPSTWGMLLAGGLAGCATWASVYPVDVVKSVIQTQPDGASAKDQSMINVSRRLFAQHGAFFFYRGLSVTMLRSFPVNAATFYLYELFQEYFRNNLNSEI